MPAALAVTAGILLDRYVGVPWPLSLLAVAVSLAGWLWYSVRASSSVVPLVCLGLAVAATGAARHHLYRDTYPADDIGNFAEAEPRPVHLRGVLDEEPFRVRQARQDALRSIPRPDPTLTVLAVTQMEQDDGWVPVSGRARLVVAEPLEGVHVGDEVDVLGFLSAPLGPSNPGEPDQAAHLRDQRIRAEVQVRKTEAGVVRLEEGWPRSFKGWLAAVKGWGQRELEEALPPEQSAIAQALLFGRGSAMTSADWERYNNTGVVHVLAISGLHLAVLSWFLWSVLRLLWVPRRYGAGIVAVIAVAYALVTGAEAPIVRSAVTVCVFCGGIVLRRPALPANALALAWLVLALATPTDLFNLGCQLSFLAVAVLYWGGTKDWFRPSQDPLDRLLDEARPAWLTRLRGWGRDLVRIYAVTLVVWLTQAPLVAAHKHVLSPSGVVLGPPVVLLAAVALVSGQLLLVCRAVCWPLAPPFAWLTRWSLAACDRVALGAQGTSGSYCYVSDVPAWWLWGFYGGLLAVLLLEPLRRRWRQAVLAGLAWLCLGLLLGLPRGSSDEFRCTFLAVGHGGCAVLETPDGRVLLYDAGALGGPDVARRHIAPFLWSRGIRRVDEIFLSHADLDHFNGVPELLERFAVGQVTCTPTFEDKPTEGVARVLRDIRAGGIPRRVVRAGDWLSAGDVQIEVLHPPDDGPEGAENARSLVLLVRHAGHALLLTGDLEEAGLARVLGLTAVHVDVLQAPHHGSRKSNTPELAVWARPQVAIACQGPPLGGREPPEPYTSMGAHFLGTWPHGAITVRSHRTGLVVETFRTGQRFAVRPGR
jgi:competence protein ComEC